MIPPHRYNTPMVNENRRFWFTLLFICLFAPFAVLLVISLVHSPTVPPAATNPQPSSPLAASSAPGGVTGPAATASRANAPILAGGNGKQIWIALPLMDGTTPGFQLFNRASNSTGWRLAAQRGTTFLNRIGIPRAMVVERGNTGGLPTIIGEQGAVEEFSLEDAAPRALLPPDHAIKAVAGAPNQLFAVTFGFPVAGTAKPFDPLPPTFSAQAAPSSQLAEVTGMNTTTIPATATAPVTTQAATEMAPAAGPQRLFSVYWFPPSNLGSSTASAPAETSPRATPTAGAWCYLPPLGDPIDHKSVPAENALMALAEQDGTLVFMWVDTEARQLAVRTLKYADPAATWSEPIRSALPEEVNATRLWLVTVDKTFYLMWPVPTGKSVELHGGWIDLRPGDAMGKLLSRNMLPAMPLGDIAAGASLADDIALAPTENSLLVIVALKDNALKSLLFSSQGVLLAGPDPVEPRSPRREVQIGQSIAMIFMALMLALSLWQWRQKATPLALPKGLVVAPLHLRAGALFIDLLAPYLVILLFFGGFKDGPLSLFYDWVGAFERPEELTHAEGLFAYLVLFFVHTTAGEIYGGKTLGKMFMGLRVVLLDGNPAKPGPIIARNLLRIPELLLMLGPLYVAISDRRQRLGDLVAKTLVVATDEEGAEQKKESGK